MESGEMADGRGVNTSATPAVTVVTATVGRPTLPRAVESVLEQTYKDFELLIFPNNLPHDYVVPRWDDPRVIVAEPFVSVNDWGAQGKMRGLRAARGEFICWLDDDDWWDRRFLKTMVVAIRKYNADLVYSRAILHERETGRILGSYLREYTPGDLEHNAFIISPTMIMRKSAVPPDYQLAIGDYAYEWYLYRDLERAGKVIRHYDSGLAHYSTYDGIWNYWAPGGYKPWTR